MQFTVTMPKLSPTMEEGVVAKWSKKEGDFVQAGEVLLEIATDKATVEFNALDEGWLRKILITEGEMARLNQPIALFTQTKEEPVQELKKEPTQPAKTEAQATPTQTEEAPKKQAAMFKEPAFVPAPPLQEKRVEEAPKGKLRASPLAKHLAKKKGLDLTTAKGTGPGGRIVSRDLETAQPAGLVTFGRQEEPTLPAGTYEEIALTPMRKTIGRRLQESKSFIPHFYVKQVIDAEPLFQIREQLKNLDLKVSFNDMIVRACALALRKHPEVNRGFNSVNQTIVQFKTVDISLAVAIPDGLITPIIRHADFKNLGQISKESRLLAEKAHHGKLKEFEFVGGSFCVSNLGMFGITEFTAVINPPQAAILAVGGIEEAAVVKDGKVVPGKRLALNLSADHRVIDGALAAHFMKTLQHLLEQPAALIL